MLTSRSTPGAALTGLTVGAVDYIPKDVFAMRVLAETLRQMGLLGPVSWHSSEKPLRAFAEYSPVVECGWGIFVTVQGLEQAYHSNNQWLRRRRCHRRHSLAPPVTPVPVSFGRAGNAYEHKKTPPTIG